MDEQKVPLNGGDPGAPEIEESVPEFANKPTPEGAMVDLAGTDAETLLLPKSGKIPYFFAYDSLLDQAIAARYVKGLIPAKVVRASNYKLVWPYFYPPENSVLPSLQRSATSSVWGQLYEARGADFTKLDKHLNCPNRYHRRALQVLDRGERRFSAFTYVLTLNEGETRRPSREYMQHLIDNAKHRGLPDDWIADLEQLL
ncbi:MAG: gamma-glutamylcyclotransferase [bacterium]|nr:gamma-glutamylcyclotransferase [bacterium]